MVMRASANDVFSQLVLGQQGVSSDGFSLDIKAVEEKWGNPDFVCLFFFIAPFYRQGADFFWV